MDLLIKQATALEHLATAFVGWCTFLKSTLTLERHLGADVDCYSAGAFW